VTAGGRPAGDAYCQKDCPEPSAPLPCLRGNGAVSTVLTAADGLQNPTSVALRRGTAYVPSAAYTTATDPNLLLAPVPHNR